MRTSGRPGPLRVAMVSEHASPLATLGGVDAGGQNVHVAALARALARRGHIVDVYTRRDGRTLPERVPMAPGVTVVHVPAGPARPVGKDELLPYMSAFGRWLEADWGRHGRPDVVHAHFWMSGLAALAAGRRCQVPVAQTFHALGSVKRRHQGAADTSPTSRVALESALCREVDLVLATCSDEVLELYRLGARRQHVRTVPCGVDTTAFTPDGPADELVPSGGRVRLLSVGRLVPRKGFAEAVAVLPPLPGVELVVAGGPPAEQLDADPEAVRLRRLAAGLGVADRVHLVGQVPPARMPALIRSARVVLAVPWYEPFGITPLEAAACGRPVVASAVGGLLDTVQDGRTGRLVPGRDPDALAAAVRPLVDDPDLAASWGAAARRRATERYDWTRVAAATERALGELTRTSPTRTPTEAAWAR